MINIFVGGLRMTRCSKTDQKTIGSYADCQSRTKDFCEKNQKNLWFLKFNLKKGCDDFYGVFNTERSEVLKNSSPIGNQIVENTYIELFKLFLETRVSIYDVVKINTDEIYVDCNIDYMTEYIKENKNQEIGGYKLPVYKIPKITRDVLKFPREFQYEYNGPNTWDIIYEDKYNPLRSILCDDMVSLINSYLETDVFTNNILAHIEHKSCRIDGFAGTGKSYKIRQIKTHLDKLGKNYKCCAFTNKASSIIEGKT